MDGTGSVVGAGGPGPGRSSDIPPWSVMELWGAGGAIEPAGALSAGGSWSGGWGSCRDHAGPIGEGADCDMGDIEGRCGVCADRPGISAIEEGVYHGRYGYKGIADPDRPVVRPGLL